MRGFFGPAKDHGKEISDAYAFSLSIRREMTAPSVRRVALSVSSEELLVRPFSV